MKKILLLIAALAFFTSCEKPITSLENTIWKSDRTEGEDGSWGQDEITFTATHATYIRRTHYGSTGEPFSGTYTFDSPTVTIEMENIGWDGEMYTYPCVGKIEGKTLHIRIAEADIIRTLELKKQ